MINLDTTENADGFFRAEIHLTEYIDHARVYSFDYTFSFPQPSECPHCYTSIVPIEKYHEAVNESRSNSSTGGTFWLIYVFFGCPSCKRPFYALYLLERKRERDGSSELSSPQILEVGPYKHKDVLFSDAIQTLSPSFCKIFNQANAAEKYQLLEIAGPGYRKSLEFLVKDYAIHLKPQDKSSIESCALVACIKNYIDNGKIQVLAERSAWIGNDETHYLRKHEDRSIQDLKMLINTMMRYIDMELAVEDASSILKK